MPTTSTKNRDRLLEGDIAQAQAQTRGLLSSEHFSVDGTLIEAWASHKSFRPKEPKYPVRRNSRKKRAVGSMRKPRHRGRRRVGWTSVFTAAAYDRVRMRSLAVSARGRPAPTSPRPRPPASPSGPLPRAAPGRPVPAL